MIARALCLPLTSHRMRRPLPMTSANTTVASSGRYAPFDPTFPRSSVRFGNCWNVTRKEILGLGNLIEDNFLSLSWMNL